MKQGDLFKISGNKKNGNENPNKRSAKNSAQSNKRQNRGAKNHATSTDVSRETSAAAGQKVITDSPQSSLKSAQESAPECAERIEYTVSQISQLVKGVLESNFTGVVVKGEISEITRAKSGHVYFTIKDEASTLSVICWRDVFNALQVNLDIGLEVVCSGKISSYPLRSNYQFILTSVKISGDGTLLKLFQERKAKLEKMGVFDPVHKLALPKFPKSICVITSEEGAVIKDIIHRVSARYPINIYLYHCQVQGVDAHLEIIKALKNLNNWYEQNIADPGNNIHPDLIIIARGGGSAQDLWPFNEEGLALAVYNSKIPIISAVGHQTDFTLCDFASDLRAPTPTAAAELAVPNMRDIARHQKNIFNGIYSNLVNLLRIYERNLSIISKSFTGYAHHLELKSSRLNTLMNSVEYLIKIKLSSCTQIIKSLSTDQIALRVFRCFDLYNTRVEQAFRVVRHLNPQNILKKGYSIVRQDDVIVTSKKSFNELENKNISIQFSDGIIEIDSNND